MRLRWFGTLDRYVLKQWMATFLLSVIGVPVVAVMIDLSERFGKLSDNNVPIGDILLGQAFLLPTKAAILVPAAVLFATVFTLNGMGRHSELTAVQGAGVSFYRLIAPMLIFATIAVPLDYELQEFASYSTMRQRQLQQEEQSSESPVRADFAYASPGSGWTWAVRDMFRSPGRASGLLGEGPRDRQAQRWTVAADSAVWNAKRGTWTLRHGSTFLVSDSTMLLTFRFDQLRLKHFTEAPSALMTVSKHAEEMTTSELRGYLNRLAASGAKPESLAVELPLKYAVPVACLIVALFGAPLAITNARAGAAVGLAIALGSTLAYLTGIQIMKAVGGRDLISPMLAAWSMNIVFLIVGVVLLARVKS